jgi:hypothetical protein
MGEIVVDDFNYDGASAWDSNAFALMALVEFDADLDAASGGMPDDEAIFIEEGL